MELLYCWFQIYYADAVDNEINKMNYNGTKEGSLLDKGVRGTEGVALDWVNK